VLGQYSIPFSSFSLSPQMLNSKLLLIPTIHKAQYPMCSVIVQDGKLAGVEQLQWRESALFALWRNVWRVEFLSFW
jgi:hypothetical protein